MNSTPVHVSVLNARFDVLLFIRKAEFVDDEVLKRSDKNVILKDLRDEFE